MLRLLQSQDLDLVLLLLLYSTPPNEKRSVDFEVAWTLWKVQFLKGKAHYR